MKVLIVNTSELTGGAAVAAHRLMTALNNNGVEAMMLVGKKQTDHHSVVTVNRCLHTLHFLWERWCIFFHQCFSRKNLFKIDIANAGTDITRLKEFREADVIHLHWINQGMLSLHSLQKILESGKPVVWTMHDMWELTAICHHVYECNCYETECGHCPYLRRAGDADLAHRVFHRKQQIYANAQRLHFVAVSNWLAACARRSTLIGRLPITTIPNSISLEQFVPIDRSVARKQLGIGERYVISFGAARIDDPIKGFEYLVNAMRKLVETGRFAASEVRLLLFGGIRRPELLQEIPVPYTLLGYINSEKTLSQIYSASNVTVSSSFYETFGQTLIEAQACGSIPVSFAGSGQADIIEHLHTGYLAERLSVDDLAQGIAWGLTADIPLQQLRENVVSRYSEDVVASQYQQLYQSITQKS
ncbi:MAG: glycosyltransferase [Prevotella sp.]|nr:glycosyltransferase [Prevotella sp.]